MGHLPDIVREEVILMLLWYIDEFIRTYWWILVNTLVMLTAL